MFELNEQFELKSGVTPFKLAENHLMRTINNMLFLEYLKSLGIGPEFVDTFMEEWKNLFLQERKLLYEQVLNTEDLEDVPLSAISSTMDLAKEMDMGKYEEAADIIKAIYSEGIKNELT